LTSSKVDLIIFTGSTEKGKLIAAAASKNLVPCILELGGKCPCVIDSSADLEFAALKVAQLAFMNSG
jgi:aldehyde dehydrogenase (NAD+)